MTHTSTYDYLASTPPGGLLAKRLGLPVPTELPRLADRPGPVPGPVGLLGRSAAAAPATTAPSTAVPRTTARNATTAFFVRALM